MSMPITHARSSAEELAIAAAAHFRAAQGRPSERRSAAMKAVLARIEADREQHFIGMPATSMDLEALERALALRLPEELRLLLGRVGGAVLYGRHELFGATTSLVHDIEVVPGLLTIRAALRRGGRLPPHHLPFHRAGESIHAVDVSEADGVTAAVVALEGGRRYPSLSVFLETVVIPRTR
jgi:hypothetical protein